MYEWLKSWYNYLYGFVYPPPPANAAYGYRWQANQGVPAALQIYDLNSPATPPGLYVAFRGGVLGGITDYFGVARGVGPVFAVPPVVSAALTNLVTTVSYNPPPGEAPWWTAPNPAQLRNIDGFLSYVADCLDLVNQTAAGAQVLTSLSTAARKPTFIVPGIMNSTAGGQPPAMNTLTAGIGVYAGGGPLPAAVIDAAVQAHYALIPGNAGKYNQLATDMNAAPLYTLFDTAANFVPNYLAANFVYNGAPLAGADLLTWAGGAGNPGFEAALSGMTVAGADGVIPREAFLQALTVTLLPQTAAGTGANAGISFDTANTAKNDHANPNFRPPAVGLAHELMHAWHYSYGTSPGFEIGVFSTTAAELKFSGIGPFAADPVTENAIRGQWAGVAGPDPSNTWPLPVPRLIYTPPTGGRTIAQMRTANGCI